MGKRTKPDGGGVDSDFGHEMNNQYHLKHNKLENLLRKKFTATYRKKLEGEIKAEHRKQLLFSIAGFIIALTILIFILVFLSGKFDLF